MNSFHSHIHKTIIISFLGIFSFVASAQATHIDSLKLELRTSDHNKSDCEIVFEIFNYYATMEQADSMNYYAKKVLSTCDLANNEENPSIFHTIGEQYKRGFSNNINTKIDSLLMVIEDPDINLLFLSIVSQNCIFYESEDQFDKYWSQAQTVIEYVKEDDSRFIYYIVLGLKNRIQGNRFTAMQSREIAASFTNVSPELLLENNYELAGIYTDQDMFDSSIEICLDLLKKAQENNQAGFVVYIYYLLIQNHLGLEDYDEVIRLAHESIAYSIRHDLDTPDGYSFAMLAKSYLALFNLAEEKRPSDRSAVYNYENIISSTYLDSAKYYLNKGVEYSLEHNQSKELVDNYMLFSDYFKSIGNREEAKLYLTKAKNEKSYEDNSELDKKLADLWSADKNYSKAYFHLNQYVDHLLQKEKNEKKDIALATKIIKDSYKYKEESEANLSKAKQKEDRLRNIIGVTLTGLVLFALLLTYVQRNRKKLEVLNKRIDDRNNELDQRNKEIDQRNNELKKSNKELDILINKQKETIKYLDNFASVAAHDLKAPIRTASSFAGLLTKTSGDKFNDREQRVFTIY